MLGTNIVFQIVSGNKLKLSSEPISNGNIYFVTDTNECAFDYGGTRHFVRDIEVLATENDRTSMLAPLNKFYVVKESGKMYLYDGEWIAIEGAGSGGSDNIFIAEYGTTTYAQVLAAYNAGKTIIAKKAEPNGLGGTTYKWAQLSATDLINHFIFSRVEGAEVENWYVYRNVPIGQPTWQADTLQFVTADLLEDVIDTTPTAGSENLITSGGVKAYVDSVLGSLDTLIGMGMSDAQIAQINSELDNIIG